MFENGVTAQLAADVRLDHECIGLALAHAMFGDVILHVVLVVVGVVGIVEPAAARGLQVVDPGQVVVVDEVGIQAKSGDD